MAVTAPKADRPASRGCSRGSVFSLLHKDERKNAGGSSCIFPVYMCCCAYMAQASSVWRRFSSIDSSRIMSLTFISLVWLPRSFSSSFMTMYLIVISSCGIFTYSSAFTRPARLFQLRRQHGRFLLLGRQLQQIRQDGRQSRDRRIQLAGSGWQSRKGRCQPGRPPWFNLNCGTSTLMTFLPSTASLTPCWETSALPPKPPGS